MPVRAGFLAILILALAAGCTGRALPVPISGPTAAQAFATSTLLPTETRIPTVTAIPDLPTLPPAPLPTRYDPLSPTLTAQALTPQPTIAVPSTLPPPGQSAPPTLMPTGKLIGSVLGLIPSSAGLWAMRSNGSQLTLLTNDPIADMAIAPSGWSVAYLTSVRPGDSAYQQPFGYTLKVITLYNDAVYTVTSIDPPDISANSSADALDSAFQALSAYAHGSMAWSPDSRYLAFTSMHAAPPNQPASSDIFLYSLGSGALRRLTQISPPNGPAFPYNLTWSPDSTRVFYAAAHGFGSSSAGLWMAGAWVAGLDGSSVQVAPGDSTGGENFISWINSNTLMLSSWKGDCGSQNLRTVNLRNTQMAVIWPGCYKSINFNASRNEVLINVTPDTANPPANNNPGLYLVSLVGQPTRSISSNGYDVILPGSGPYGPDKATWYGYAAGQGLVAIQRDGTTTKVFSGPPFDSTTGVPFRPLFRLTNGDWLWTGDGLSVCRPGYPPQQIIATPYSSFSSSPSRDGLFFYFAPSGDHTGLYGIRSRDWKPFLIDDHIPNPGGIAWTG